MRQRINIAEQQTNVTAEQMIAEGLATGPATKTKAEPAADPAKAAESAATAAATADGGGQLVTRDQLDKLIGDGIKKALEASKGERETADVRSRFIIEKMSDLPIAVQNLLPAGGDLKELTSAEQDIRAEMSKWFQANLKRLGLKMPDVDGGAGTFGSLAPIQTSIDTRSISPEKLIAMGIEQETARRR